MTIYSKRRSWPEQHELCANLLKTVAVADAAAAQGRHPFGCTLVDESGKVVLEQGNIDTVNHAEITIARTAFAKFAPAELWKMTLYTNFEPCAMCTAACYWANIGRIVYGVPESKLLEYTGDHPENPTMSLSCRETLRHGSKDIQVKGPFPEVEQAIVQSHINFWKTR